MRTAFTSVTTIDAARHRVLVAEAGPGAQAEPVVMLHGNPDTHDVWSDVVAELAPSVRCIAPDLPGYGGSSPPGDHELTLDAAAAWVAAVLDALGLQRVHLVVHDVGGPYGLAFTTLHPSRVRSLTIMNTSFFPDYRWHFWARVWRTRGLGEIAMKLMNRPLFRREVRRGSPRISREYADHAYDAYTPSTRATVLRWYRAMTPSVLAGWDQRLLASLGEVPHQVVWGDLDPYIPMGFADRYPGARAVHHRADVGHWAMVEEPGFVAAKIRALVSTGS